MMGKTLVTGATGFTGKALCRKLAQGGEQVVAFVRPTGNHAALREMGVEVRQVEITDPASVRANFDGIEQVYHIAAAYRAEHASKDIYRQVNVEATRHLLDIAKDKAVRRFVHCSTVGVQGEIDDPPADEDYRFKPGDHYQESKMEGELLARKYFKEGLPGVVVRPVGIYGPGDTRFLKLFRSIDKGMFLMIGKGDILYHMTYIDDLVDGIILAGHRQEIQDEVFTIAGEQYTTLKELVDLIAEVLGRPRPRWRIPYWPVHLAAVLCDGICSPLGLQPPIYPRRVEFFKLDRAFSIDKAKRLLGYQPQVSLRDGLTSTAAWYRQQGLIR